MLDPGAIVGGRYQIVRVIGHGGMGEVYEAVQSPLGRKVALKTIRPDLGGRPDLIARFRREAESAAALGHPNIVQVTDFQDAARAGEAPFLVMEMLDGETLASVLGRDGRIDPQRAAFIAVQLLSGLAAAHRAGIVHRDVKPANVFLQSTSAVRDLVKVLDFGIAKLELDAAAGARPMTRAGEVLGTYAYMAPEQRISGGAVDARTDVFGVGATLFHALAGLRVIEATTPGAGRTPLAQVAPWVNRELAAVVERALADRPEMRFQSAEEMAAALAPFAPSTGAAPGASPSRPASSGRGLDASAIGRMEAPTGGSAFGASSFGPSAFGQSSISAPARSGDPSLFASTPPGAMTPAPAPAPAPTETPRKGGWNAYAGTGPPPPAGSSHGFSAPAPAALPFGSVRDYGALPTRAPQPSPMHPTHLSQPPAGMMQGMMPHAPAPMGHAPARSSFPIWIPIVIAVVVLGMGAPYIFSILAVRSATNPDTIATNIERQVLNQPRPPCPAPEQCTVSREEHGLVYPLCTKRSPKTTEYKTGEMVLAGSDERIALVSGNLGGGKYNIRFLSKQAEETVADNEIFGRICRAGVRSGE